MEATSEDLKPHLRLGDQNRALETTFSEPKSAQDAPHTLGLPWPGRLHKFQGSSGEPYTGSGVR